MSFNHNLPDESRPPRKSLRLTPPFGYNLFTAVSVSGLNFKQIVKGSLPFLITEILLLFIFAYVPGIITWLPRLMGYSY